MQHTKRSSEGYLMMDHKASPGLADEFVIQVGLPPGAGQSLFESAVVFCSHCPAMVVLNPKRTREREYCATCDHYICDVCGLRKKQGVGCKTNAQQLEEHYERIVKQTLIKEV